MSTSLSLRTTAEPQLSVTTGAPAEPEILRRERADVHEILRLVAERAAAEAALESAWTSNNTTADTEYQQRRQGLIEKSGRLDQTARADDEQRRRDIVAAAMAGEGQAKAEFATASRRIASAFDATRERSKTEYGQAKERAEAGLETNRRAAEKTHVQALQPIQDATRIADSIRQRLAQIAEDYRGFGLDPTIPPPPAESYAKLDDPVFEVLRRLDRIEPALKLLEGLVIPKVMRGRRAIGLILGIILLLVVGAAVAGGGTSGCIAAAVVGLVLGIGLSIWLRKLARTQLVREYDPLRHALGSTDALIAHCRVLADRRFQEIKQQHVAQRDEDLKRAKEARAQAVSVGEATRDEQLRKINTIYAERMVDVQTEQARDLREALDTHDRRMAELKEKSATSLQKLDASYQALKDQIRQRHDTAKQALADRWRAGMQAVTADLAAIHRAVDGFGPAWDDPSWSDRPVPQRIPPVLRFGTVALDLAALPHGIAADPDLMAGITTAFQFPALRAFPETANLLIEAPSEGRAAALAVLHASMFRLLTSLPPGQVRFTIIDPIGIGRNFGAFMHLSDFDPALVTSQVWTDARQIEERLAELAAHMETVTQKYLRNEYATIEEYNAVAGEVAEPYRVLVVADFPSQFQEKSAARLAAIAAGGLPCGVLTLVAVDPTKPMPNEFRLDDLRSSCAHLTWNGTGLVWDDPDLGHWPLTLDPPPPAEFATRQIQKVGAAAKDARRVEVPFDFIAPAPDAWWSRDSRAGIDVPLGKAGATRRQHLALGQGTSQHVLIAGRTGSGKSTLMHALITNLALNYSPDEIELYLIDFKKGVEFKVYATHELPHASVVAIESEREFGISVLQRIDAEMRLRADRFREAGVQDLQGYRNLPGAPPLPRILLIVDEFQEFFVEEDKLAQEAALLLDRLVRQGRAFGIHVHLGSQSLGGAFTLARSTLGQMAVRIALQCSEVDSHLILSENNAAARSLSRPGEAIYNDANGAPEGNHFFQVVWLPDERREAYLQQLHALARQRQPGTARVPIVFEGNAPAEIARNPLLRQRLEAISWPESPRSARAWLGEAVAIKDPTAALFRRQGGNHLLIVGPNEAAAMGVMAAALVSLATQYPPAGSDTDRSGARFFLLDGTPEDHPEAGTLTRVAAVLPHGVQIGHYREAARFLAAVAAEVERRQQTEGGDGPEIFLFIHDLPRFRDLRRREDDFGFGRREEAASPSDHLELILREGPNLGIHAILWCDTVNNLNRYFTHQLIREFEMRVLFQMSPTDSGHLLDSPQASRLGPHRALFASEEQNLIEKFRPYGIPPDEWLRQVGGSFRDRAARSPLE